MRPGFNHTRENAPSGRVYAPHYGAARHSAVMRSGFNHAGEKRAFRASDAPRYGAVTRPVFGASSVVSWISEARKRLDSQGVSLSVRAILQRVCNMGDG